MFENILVVCIGNICRSPVAEAFFKRALISKNEKNYTISSAGIGALVGHKPDNIVCELMLDKGIDISDYRATQLNQQMLHNADLILVMESAHKSLIERNHPSVKGKVFRLGEWGHFEITDPYRQERKVFVESVKLIEAGVADWVSKI